MKPIVDYNRQLPASVSIVSLWILGPFRDVWYDVYIDRHRLYKAGQHEFKGYNFNSNAAANYWGGL